MNTALMIAAAMGRRVVPFDPLALFANGAYDGFYYDFSKTDQLYQDSLGQTVVAVDADPVGLAFEAHSWDGRTLAQQIDQAAEQIVNGGFGTDTVWTKGTGWTIAAGVAACSPPGGTSNLSQPVAFTGTVFQWLTYTLTRNAGTLFPRFSGGSTINGTSRATSGTFRDVMKAAVGNVTFTFVAAATTDCTVDNVSVKPVVGNHGAQATASSRPAWKSPDFIRGDATDDNLLTSFVCGASGNSAVAKVKVPASLAATQVVMGASGSSTARFFVGFDTSGQLVGGVGTDDVTTVLHASDYRGLTGVLALVENGSNWFLYWNGVRVAIGARNGAPTTTIPWRIFAQNNNGTAAAFAAADVFYLFAINRPLPASDVLGFVDMWGTS